MDLRGAQIFITGGAGYLGRHIIQRFYKEADITVYSRDEAKHYYLRKLYPRVRCLIGDVRNLNLMLRASRGCDVGIFAASLKQIEACDENPDEALEVIVTGAQNSRRVVEENRMKAGCFISTDKSRAATTIYGAMKYVGGEMFIANAHKDMHLSTAIYGNVLNSTGSIIPLIWTAIQNRITLELYHPEMTRFMLTADEAVTLIVKALSYNGVNIIPRIHSFRIIDVFEIYKRRFGLQYNLGRPRPNEKIHEIMACAEEIERMIYVKEDDVYLMCPRAVSGERLSFPSNDYCSKDFAMPAIELDSYLGKFDYFRPSVK